MNLGERQGLTGVLTIELVDTGGAVVERRRVQNLITRSGKKLLADLLMGKADALPSGWAIVVGTGESPARPADTALLKPAAEAEAEAPRVEVVEEGGQSAVRATVIATLPAPASSDPPQPLAEAGIRINQGERAETLFNRVTFAQVNRGPNMVLRLTWEITF